MKAMLLAVLLAACLLASPAAADPVDAVCSGRFPITSGTDTLQVPICSNRSLTELDGEVTRAVIVINGAGRNADEYHQYIVDAAQASGVSAGTLIIAPQFLTYDDLEEHYLPDEDAVPYWSSGGWKKGSLSKDEPLSRPFRLSSFEVVDRIVAAISDRSIFPNLDKVVFAGHSAGGQFVNRFASGTALPETHPENVYRFIAANPSSWLYFDAMRPEPGSMTSFRELTSVEREDCSDYNDYKYGLQDLNSYMDAVGAETLPARYEHRNVIYLLGQGDHDPESSSLDDSCEGMWEGPNRLYRGTAFHNYLGQYYGTKDVYRTHILALVPDIDHDGEAMFNSSVGRDYLFP